MGATQHTRSADARGPQSAVAHLADEMAEVTAALGSSLDLPALTEASPADLCNLISALEKLKHAACAAQARATVVATAMMRDEAIADGVAPERAEQGIPQQIGLARRESPFAGSRHIGFARAVVHEMPHTHAAMTEGWLPEWTAMQLVRETACLSREHRAAVDAHLADRLRRDSTKKLVGAAKAMAYELDPYAFVARGRKATRNRRVSVRPAPEVMSIVTGFLPVAKGVACYKALDDSARALKAAGDERSLDQLRADLFAERLTGQSAADGPDIELGLVMTDTALLGLDETAARLEHLGPLPAPMARDLVRAPGDARSASGDGAAGTGDTPGVESAPSSCQSPGPEAAAAGSRVPASDTPDGSRPGQPSAREAVVWLRRLYADPLTGVLTDQDERRRRFTGPLRRFLVARDQECRTPWCDAPIRHADHVLPFVNGGLTNEQNGQGTCEACNYGKEAPGWRHRTTQAGDGAHVVQVRTPSGQLYESHAPPILPTLGLRLARPPDRQRRTTGSARISA